MPKKGNAEEKEQKRPPWRPTKYKPEYCEEIIDLAKKGYSIPKIAVHWGVPKQRLFTWADDFEDFRDALDLAYTILEDYWTDPIRVAENGDILEYSIAVGDNQFEKKTRLDMTRWREFRKPITLGRIGQRQERHAHKTLEHEERMQEKAEALADKELEAKDSQIQLNNQEIRNKIGVEDKANLAEEAVASIKALGDHLGQIKRAQG